MSDKCDAFICKRLRYYITGAFCFFKDEIKSENGSKSLTEDAAASNSSEETNEPETNLQLFKTKKRFGKNPFVDTSFLPDKERELEEDMLR